MKSAILRRNTFLSTQLYRLETYLSFYDSIITSKQTEFISRYNQLVHEISCTFLHDKDLQCFQCLYLKYVPYLLIAQLQLVSLLIQKEDILSQIQNAISYNLLQLTYFTEQSKTFNKSLPTKINKDTDSNNSFTLQNSSHSFQSFTQKNQSQSFLSSFRSCEQIINDIVTTKKRKIDLDALQTLSVTEKSSQCSSLSLSQSFVSKSQRFK